MPGSVSVEQVIEHRLHQIDEQIEALNEERARLERARVALDGQARTSSNGAKAARRHRAGRSRRALPSQRAPRGSNLKAILSYVAANPGSTTSQISAGTGIAKTVVYSAVARLTSADRLRREPLPDGQVAYHPSEP